MRRHILLCLLFLVIMLVLSSLASTAITISFRPDSINGTDGWIYQGAPTTNYGTSGLSYVGDVAQDNIYKYLVNWNFTCESLPAGSTVTNVTFEVTKDSATGVIANISAYRMNMSTFEHNVTWDNCGDDGYCYPWYNDSTNASNPASNILLNWTDISKPKINFTFNASYFQNMCDIGDDFGIIMFSNVSVQSGVSLGWHSSDASTAANRPNLTIIYIMQEVLTTPTIVAPSPEDNSINSTNVTINITHGGINPADTIRFYLYFGDSSTLTEDDLVLTNVSRMGEDGSIYFVNWTTNVSDDGVYYWKAKVYNITDFVFSSNTTQRNWTLDTTNPTITLNQTNAFNTTNISSHNQYLDFMILNITFKDEIGLFGILINVTQDSVSYFNHTNISLNSVLLHKFSRNVSTVTWPDGVFDIEVTVADGHTLNKIEDYKVSGFLSRVTFRTEEGNKIDIIGSGAISTEYSKKRDRYEFGFNYLTSETERTFTIKCDNDLYYIEKSNYEGHFVCWNPAKKNGNWIDFEGLNEDYIVRYVNDREYEITFSNLKPEKKVIIKSIGGLNVVTENYQWFKGSTTNIFSSTASAGSEQQFQLNITLDFDLVNNIVAGFSYNGTPRTVTDIVSATSILFDSTFTVPNENRTFNVSWTLNVTQRDESFYSFLVNSTQDLVTPQVNLTIKDEENQSLITEDVTIFFTGPTSIQVNTSSGTLSVGELKVGEYFIQAESASYPRRGLFFTVTNASANVDLYLVIDLAGNDFIDYIVQDDGRNRLNDVRLTFQKNINNSFITVAQIETDFAGQARIFQDQQNEYRIVMSLAGFATQTIDLIPLLTSYTLTLSTIAEQLFDTTYEGIRYTISPAARILNASGNFENISFTIFDGTSSLEYFGLNIINHSYECIPASCITNISGSPAGGTATVQVKLNVTGSFDTLYFFKRNGFPIQFINGQVTSVRFLIGDRLADNFAVIGANLGTPVMRAIFAAILITVFAVLASQLGVIGLGLMMVISFGTIFFMLLGFIPRMVAMITLFFGIAIYFVLGREQ